MHRSAVLRPALLALTAFGVLATVSSANASQLFIQQSGTAPAGGDPNLITNPASFVIGPAGNQTYLSPTLVVVAEYNGVGTPTISFSGCSTPSACSLAPVGTYGLTSNNGTATLTGSGKGSVTVFSQLGLNAGGSENFTNLSGADTAIGLAAPTSFSLYAFSVPAALTASSQLTIDTTATTGSFILGYACQSASTGAQCSNGNLGETVFTNTGLVDGNTTPPPTPTPEPATLTLVGAALAGMAVAGRRRRGAI